MKQKTSVYLDDSDREAMQQVGAYYGITSDTDVLCFSVRALARALPTRSLKEEQAIMIPVQHEAVMKRKQWQIDVYTSQDQAIPHTLYDETLTVLRKQVFDWLMVARPPYIQAGIDTYRKRDDGMWIPPMAKNNEEAYQAFCQSSLGIHQGPEYQEQGVTEGIFHLEYIRKVDRHDHEPVVNQMLQRGWRLLSLEKHEDGGTWYVLGHTEEDAF